MTGYELYNLYRVLKVNFNTDAPNLTAVKKSGAAYQDRNDRAYFESLARKKHCKEFLLANIVYNTNFWIGDEDANDIYLDWKTRIESLSYNYMREIESIKKDLNTYLTDGSFIYDYYAGRISIESICILECLLGFSKKVDKHLSNNVLWKEVKIKVKSYCPYISDLINKNRVRKITLDHFKSLT